MKIGILAYGSLIGDPGKELEAEIVEKRSGIRTPFRVEFARTSTQRDGAPTLVPVDKGGAYVEAFLLILRDGITLESARDMLYRREIHARDSDKAYRPDPGKQNQVWVETIPEWFGVDVVLYTRIAANIDDLSPENLAHLAIKSASSSAREDATDGISYLIDAKRAWIRTPLSDAYESGILRLTDTETLEEAWRAAGSVRKEEGE